MSPRGTTTSATGCITAGASPFKSGIPIYDKWDYKHQPPGADKPLIALPNVLPDLAVAMKQNPDLKVMVNGGYFDVSTPYFEGRWRCATCRSRRAPAAATSSIDYYESGHMVYVHPPSLRRAARQRRRLHPADVGTELTGNELGEFLEVDVAARNDADDRPLARLTGQRRRERKRARPSAIVRVFSAIRRIASRV